MMVDAEDMSAPATRGELRAELSELRAELSELENRLVQRLDQRLDEKFEEVLPQKLAHLATKQELELWGGALLARIESSEQRLLTELGRHTKAIEESMSR